MAAIAQQLTELVNQKNALAANLTTKGVTASSSETLNTLVPKVLDIQTGGGDDNKFKDLVDRSITTVTVEDLEGVTSIGNAAFQSCSKLTSITLPNTITKINNSAFAWSGIITMRIEATTPPTLTATGAISMSTTQIQVPMASVEAYKTATGWSYFADIIVGYEEDAT